jgi:hypothetical protein
VLPNSGKMDGKAKLKTYDVQVWKKRDIFGIENTKKQDISISK